MTKQTEVPSLEEAEALADTIKDTRASRTIRSLINRARRAEFEQEASFNQYRLCKEKLQTVEAEKAKLRAQISGLKGYCLAIERNPERVKLWVDLAEDLGIDDLTDKARAWDARAEVQAENAQLRARVEKMRSIAGFFASVVKSGEPWTTQCGAQFAALTSEADSEKARDATGKEAADEGH